MSRFIFYSGLAHCVAFVGVIGYMSTRPKESLPDFLQSKSVPHVEVTSNREVIEMGVASGSAARHEIADDDSTRELRDRKIRANLPTPPETPRVVDKVNGARKIPTQLPAKKGASHIHQVDAPAPETGRDIPLETAMTTEAANADEGDVANAAAAAAENDVQNSVENSGSTSATVAEGSAEEPANEASADTDETEKLQIAAFDVDELAETHLQKLKAQEELEHQQRMARLQAEKEAALLAVAEEQRQAQEASAGGEGPNEGEIAEASAPSLGHGTTTEGAPSQGEVRSLSQIRQAPGNRLPQYDTEDRRQGRQGLVVFLAYIKEDGHPKEFQLAASSGHRSLDAKTLKALKGWKFQPGQEGWVEIPFQWDLKGGAQEAPSQLRRQGSR